MLFGFLGSLDHGSCLGHIQRQGFFDDSVFAGLKGGDAGLLVNIVGSAIVKKFNSRIINELFPIGGPVLVAKPSGSFLDGLFVSAANSLQ